MKLKFKEKITQATKKDRPTINVGIHKRSIKILWCVLIVSVVFGVYKNFTAIDKHTIHEKEVIEKKVVDTNKVESFVEQFVYKYYTWGQSPKEIENHNNGLKDYLTEELQALNADMIRSDIPTKSKASDIQIWSVEQEDDNNYKVTYSVVQQVTENKAVKMIDSTYHVVVHVDDQTNMVIIQNPTIDSKPNKSDYEPKDKASDGTVDADESEEMTEFLETFFQLYPKATDKELAYYVSNDTLPVISKNYVFAELVNPIYTRRGNDVTAIVTVKYLDQETKTVQLSQFELTLQKLDNWKIIK